MVVPRIWLSYRPTDDDGEADGGVNDDYDTDYEDMAECNKSRYFDARVVSVPLRLTN